MAKYKALEAFPLEGAAVEVGQEVELGEAQAAELAGKVELVPEAPAAEAVPPAASEEAGAKPE